MTIQLKDIDLLNKRDYYLLPQVSETIETILKFYNRTVECLRFMAAGRTDDLKGWNELAAGAARFCALSGAIKNFVVQLESGEISAEQACTGSAPLLAEVVEEMKKLNVLSPKIVTRLTQSMMPGVYSTRKRGKSS